MLHYQGEIIINYDMYEIYWMTIDKKKRTKIKLIQRKEIRMNKTKNPTEDDI